MGRRGGRPATGLPPGLTEYLVLGGAETILGKEIGGLELHFLVWRVLDGKPASYFIIRAKIEIKFKVTCRVTSILWCLRDFLPTCLQERKATSSSGHFYCR